MRGRATCTPLLAVEFVVTPAARILPAGLRHLASNEFDTPSMTQYQDAIAARVLKQVLDLTNEKKKAARIELSQDVYDKYCLGGIDYSPSDPPTFLRLPLTLVDEPEDHVRVIAKD